jgi:hypothetical protein
MQNSSHSNPSTCGRVFCLVVLKIMGTITPVAKDSTQKMQTLSETMNSALEKGYRENFKVEGATLVTEDGGHVYKAEDVSIANFYRFEGYSDPADNSILYLIETRNGPKGMLLDAYDAYADARISKFIKEVDDIQKKAPHEQ